MASNNVTLQLVDVATPHDDLTSLDYLPFGVKMLKLRVQRNQETNPDLGRLVLRTKGYLTPDVGSNDPARWNVYGTADDAPELWVVWGAGIEEGAPVRTIEKWKLNKEIAPLKDDNPYYIYLHLVHRPDDPATHTPGPYILTIQAIDLDNAVDPLQGEKVFTLTVPETAVNPIRPLWQSTTELKGTSTIRLGGAAGDDRPVDVPDLVSRWWPRPGVAYRPADDALATLLEKVVIDFRREQGDGKGAVTVRLGDSVLATVDGDVGLPVHDFRLFLPELFRFPDDHHLLLRLWFYWAKLRFSEEELGRYVPGDLRDKDPWKKEIARLHKRIGGGPLGLFPSRKNDEIPDLERLDVVVDPVKKEARYVGTDTHWQEFWLRNKLKRVQARIATGWDAPKAIKQNNAVPKVEEPITIPLENGLCDIIHEGSDHFCPFRPPADRFDVVVAEDYDEDDEYTLCPRCHTRFLEVPGAVRAVGLLGKHAPLVEEATILDNMVSNNVLNG